MERFKADQAVRALQRYAHRRGVALSALTPRALVDLVLGFYREDGSAYGYEDDADMLLFQWGSYGFGRPPRFEFDLTRQLMTPGEGDDGLWQLRVTLRFESTPESIALGSGDRWCSEPAELESFGAFIRASAPFALLADRPGGELVIALEAAG